MMSLACMAELLGGEVSSGQVLAPAFGHSPRDRSLSIRINPSAPGGLIVHLFSAGDVLAEKDRVLDTLGILRKVKHRHGLSIASLGTSHVAEARKRLREQHKRTARALAIFHESVSLWGTPVEAFLTRERGLSLFDDVARSVRYHPACPFAGTNRIPAMVCLVRDVETDVPKAIHRTAISLDGRKVKIGGLDRQSLGPVRGGAIKFTSDENVTTCLGVGEGLESTLSLRLLPEFGSFPVWSLLSAGGVERLPVLSGVGSLWLAVDHDVAGINASRSCAKRWQRAGSEVLLVRPDAERSDLNDLFRRQANG